MTPMASTNRNFNLTLGQNFKAKPRYITVIYREKI